jgi:hypothetical protein
MYVCQQRVLNPSVMCGMRWVLGVLPPPTASLFCAALGVLLALYSHTTVRRVAEWADDERLLNATQRTCEHSSAVRASNRRPPRRRAARTAAPCQAHSGACVRVADRCG